MLSLPDFKEKNIIICFATEGQRISFKNDNLIIKDVEDKIILQATCHRIFSLWIVGSTTITSGVLQRSKKFAFSIYMLSYSHRLYGLWGSATDGNFLLRRKQYEYEGLEIARHLVKNKMANQKQLISTIRKKDWEQKEAIERLEDYLMQAAVAESLKQLLGIEGIASRIYFSSWFKDMGWKGRKPRAKMDILNTTMDIGYTYLFNIIECMLNLYGFDLYQGVYHQSFYQRKSLVCDLVEPFRCIVDKQIRKAYNLKQLQAKDFREQKGQYFLKIEMNKAYTRWMIQGILDHKEDIFTYAQEYYRCFMRGKTIDEYPTFNIKSS